MSSNIMEETEQMDTATETADQQDGSGPVPDGSEQGAEKSCTSKEDTGTSSSTEVKEQPKEKAADGEDSDGTIKAESDSSDDDDNVYKGNTSKQLIKIINVLMKNDDKARKEVEVRYEEFEPEVRHNCLWKIYRDEDANSIEIRYAALVLLRKLTEDHLEEWWCDLQERERRITYIQIMKVAPKETDLKLRRLVCAILAQFALHLSELKSGEETSCKDFVEYIMVCSRRNDMHDVAMNIIETVPNVFGTQEQVTLSIEAIHDVFKRGMDNDNQETQIATVKAFAAFMADNPAHHSVFAPRLMVDVLNVIANTLRRNASISTPLPAFIELTCSVPFYMKEYINHILNMCLATVVDNQKQETFRFGCVEIVASLAENAPLLFINQPEHDNYSHVILQYIIAMTSELSDDLEEWAKSDEDEDSSDEQIALAGSNALERIAKALCGRKVETFVKPFVSIVSPLFQSKNWKKRHSAIMATGQVYEGCHKLLARSLSKLVNFLLPRMEDEIQRVRYATLLATTKMIPFFDMVVYSKYHPELMTTLPRLMNDFTSPRVVLQAADCLVSFTKHCPRKILHGYMAIMSKALLHLLRKCLPDLNEPNHPAILKKVLSCVAHLASIAPLQFTLRYKAYFKLFIQMLYESNEKLTMSIRYKVIDCMAQIGTAAGPSKFKAHCHIMTYYMVQSLRIDDNICQIDGTFTAWRKLCMTLGNGFATYLPHILPAIVQKACFLPPAFKGNPALEGANENIDLAEFRTEEMHEKVLAFDLLNAIALNVTHELTKFLNEFTQLSIVHLAFYPIEQIRMLAANTLSLLIRTMKTVCKPDFLTKIAEVYLRKLTDTVKSEKDIEVVACMIRSMSKIIQYAGPSCIKEEQINDFKELFTQQLVDYDTRKKELIAQKRRRPPPEAVKDPNSDADDLEGEFALLHALEYFTRIGFQTCKEQFWPVIADKFGTLLKLTEPSIRHPERENCLLIIASAIRYSTNKVPGVPKMLGTMFIRAVSDKQPKVQQAAALGLTHITCSLSREYGEVCLQALRPLCNLVSQSTDLSKEQMITREKCMATIIRISLTYAKKKEIDELIAPRLMNWLPAIYNHWGSWIIYDFFAKMVEEKNVAVLGANGENYQKAFEIICVASCADVFDNTPQSVAVQDRLIAILRNIPQDQYEKLIEQSNLEPWIKSYLFGRGGPVENVVDPDRDRDESAERETDLDPIPEADEPMEEEMESNHVAGPVESHEQQTSIPTEVVRQEIDIPMVL